MKTIYFNEQFHKYTDELSNLYTSVTTVISRYEPSFLTKTEARKCYHKYHARKGHRYYGMTEQQIIRLWDDIRDKACEKGTRKHNYLEQVIKEANGYKLVEGTIFINDRIYTVDNILQNHNYGRVDIQYFIDKGFKEKYPSIFAVLVHYHNLGYSIYPEICTYSHSYLISGLIDVLLVKGNDFVILDWKTNKDDLHFEAGYFKRDFYGADTDEWINTDQRMLSPLINLPKSKGTLYTLQLSLYAHLTELKGLTCKGLHLCHIRDNEDGEYIEWHNIKYWKNEVTSMIDDFNNKQLRTRNTQLTIEML